MGPHTSVLTLLLVSVFSDAYSETNYKSSNFLLTTCQAGVEKVLKTEVLLNHPQLRPAYSRPGLVTFKSDEILSPDVHLNSIFARSYSLSLGPAPDLSAVAKIASDISENCREKIRLHVWGRDEPGKASEHPLAVQAAGECVKKIRSELLHMSSLEHIWIPPAEESSAKANSFSAVDSAKLGEYVFNVVVPTGPYATDPMYVGFHRHTASHSRWPGGDPRILLPTDAPSRAFLKIEETMLWAGLEMKPGQVAVEVGSAPGGCSLALLRRGLSVVGIDPCPQDRQHDAVVRNHPNFSHIRSRLAGVKREQLPPTVDWLLCDANVTPQSILPLLSTLAVALSPTLKGVIINLKLNNDNWDTGVALIPEFLDKVRAMGMTSVRATQLPSHGQEIVAVGLKK